MKGGILIYAESNGGVPAKVSLELIGKAQELAKKSGGPVSAVLICEGAENCARALACYPVDQIYVYDISGGFRADLYAELLTDCISAQKPEILLVGGTLEGRAAAPRVAAQCRTGITADCTELDIDELGRLAQIRPAFGGNIMARIVTPERRPQIATVRPGVMRSAEPSNGAPAKIIKREVHSAFSRIEILDSVSKVCEIGIDDAETLVVAGRGVESKDDLDMLRRLAELLGGQLASSRALVEKGWMPQSRQIGLSGHAVSPKVLLTFGVSGSVQFRAGIQNADVIVAVDKNPNADIFKIAHYPICADLYEVVPGLINNLTEKN